MTTNSFWKSYRLLVVLLTVAVASGLLYAQQPVTISGTPTVSVSGSVTVAQATASNLKVDLSGTGANSTAIKVDGSAVTQPVSGTVTVQQGTGTNLHMVCDSGCSSSSGFTDNAAFTFGTTAINPIGGVFDDVSSNTATENSAAIARITQNKALHINLRNASGTEIGTASNPVRMDPTGTTTQPTNVAQLAGTTTDTNSGNKSAGTLRVVIATDQPQLTNKLLVTPDANHSVNVNQWNGQSLASPDANSYTITAPAASATSTLATSACNILSAASTNSTSCKGSAGNFYGYEVYNTTTTVYYLRLYNSSSAPTCSSSTGFIRSIPIPPAGASGQVGGAVSNQVLPVNYSTGIGYCITGGSSSTDNTNAATGLFGEIRYK